MRAIIRDMLLLLAVSLCLALLYNALSPSGLRILPKKRAAAAALNEAGT